MGGWAKIGENLNQYTNKMEEIFVSAELSTPEDLAEAMGRAADGSILIHLYTGAMLYKFNNFWYPVVEGHT